MCEEETTSVWPPNRHAFDQLREMGKVGYGESVSFDVLIDLFKVGSDLTSWKFRGEYLALRQLFEEHGFLVTERGMNGNGFRVLNREEMADLVRQRETNKANDSLRKSLTLSLVPRDGMAEVDARKIDHWETKAAVIGATSKLLLRKRSLPQPDQAVKSIRQQLQQGADE